MVLSETEKTFITMLKFQAISLLDFQPGETDFYLKIKKTTISIFLHFKHMYLMLYEKIILENFNLFPGIPSQSSFI